LYEYNPLAEGLLTDHYKRETVEHEEGSRYDPKRNQGATIGGDIGIMLI